MLKIDLNLLTVLNALLTECNITKAAQKQNMSVSAMSRALNRLRTSLNDPILVKSGRSMVLTPYALGIHTQVMQLVHQLDQVFTLPDQLDLQGLTRLFTLRSSAGFAENYGAALLAFMREEAPNTTLQIITKEIKQGKLLKQGEIDGEISVISDKTEPEMKSRFLFSDRLIGAVHLAHPLAHQPITFDNLTTFDFIGVNRQHEFPTEQLDDCACSAIGLIKSPILTVTGFSTALAIAQNSQLIAIVPERFTHNLRKSLFSFVLPYKVPSINISLLWHPRMNNDLAHKWFRKCILHVCQQQKTRP